MKAEIRGNKGFTFEQFDELVLKYGSRKIKIFKKNQELIVDRKLNTARFDYLAGLVQGFQACKLKLGKNCT